MADDRKRRQQLPAILALGAALLAGVTAIALWTGGSAAEGEGADPLAFAGEEALRDAEWSVDEPGGDLAEDEFAAPLARVAVSDTGTTTSAVDAPADTRPADGLTARGTLLDSATGEPLPFYDFEIQDAGREAALVSTDERGEFEANERLRRGPLLARYFEAGMDLVSAGELRANDAGEAEPLMLRVTSGPTYRIALTPLPTTPLDQFSARLEYKPVGGPPRVRGAILPTTPTAVRFAPLPDGVTGDGRIVLDSRDGVWRGSEIVALGSGLQRGVVAIPMVAFAALQVSVVSEDGKPQKDATVAWIPDEGQRPRDEITRNEGRVVFDRLPSASGTLRVRKLRFVDHVQPMTLLRGECTVRTVRLLRAPSAGSIAGMVLSDTGKYSRTATMRLVPRVEDAAGLRPLSANVAWSQESGAIVGRFRFDGLPIGTWRLVVGENDWYEWEPTRLDVEAPRTGLEFRVHDSVPVADLLFAPVDASGQHIEEFQVQLQSGSDRTTERTRTGPVLVEAFPVDRDLRWRLDAPGYAAEFGTWSTLAPLAAVGGRVRHGARPRLDEGATQMFRVVRSDNRRPIEGAVAVIDGREAGRTDAQGRVVVHGDDAGSRVRFQWKGWRQIDAVDLRPVVRRNTPFERSVRLEVPKQARKKG